jgi:hypothetical protein
VRLRRGRDKPIVLQETGFMEPLQDSTR